MKEAWKAHPQRLAPYPRKGLFKEAWKAQNPRKGLFKEASEAPYPRKGLFEEAWKAQNPRKGLLKDAWKAPYPGKGLFEEAWKPQRLKMCSVGLFWVPWKTENCTQVKILKRASRVTLGKKAIWELLGQRPRCGWDKGQVG